MHNVTPVTQTVPNLGQFRRGSKAVLFDVQGRGEYTRTEIAVVLDVPRAPVTANCSRAA
jgi:hypothetical protein